MPRGAAIPTLETPRLRLRGFRADDHADYAAIRADPEVARFIGGPHDAAASWERMAFMNGHWSLRGYGPLAVEEKATGRVVGHSGLLHPADWPEPEIVYSIARPRWGQGFAAEAAAAVRDWAYAAHPFPRLVSFMDPANARSIRVAEKLGAARGPALSLRGHAAHAWVHPRGQG